MFLHLGSFAREVNNSQTYDEAIKLYENKNYSAAQEKLVAELKTNPLNREADFYLAEILFNNKYYKSALSYYRLANLGFDKPFAHEAYYKAFLCCYYLKDYNGASAIARFNLLNHKDIIKDNQELANIYYIFADCHLNLKYKALAISEFKNVLEYDSKNYKANKALGMLYYKDKKYDEALLYLSQANCIEKTPDVLKTLGLIYTSKREYEKARDSFLESIALMPYDSQCVRLALVENIAIAFEEITFSSPPVALATNNQAPASIHNLVKVEGIVDKKCVDKLHLILDLIWSNPDGRILLKKLYANNLNIYLNRGVETSSVTVPSLNISFDDGFGNIPSKYIAPAPWDFLKINLKESQINGKKADGCEYYMPILTVVHEFCHAVYRLESYGHKSTKEEEFLSTIIGANIAHKVLYKAPLSQYDTINLALSYKILIDKNKGYKNLALSNPNFVNTMASIGIEPPNYALYSDYYTESKFKRDSMQYFGAYVQRFFTFKKDFNYKQAPKFIFAVDNNGFISNILLISSSGNIELDKKCVQTLLDISPIPPCYVDKSDAFMPVYFSLD